MQLSTHSFRKHPACRAAVAAIAWLTLVCGCSPGYQQETVQVRGNIKLNGKPVPGGKVMFVPNSGRGAVGIIDSNGDFVLGTYDSNDGAIVGKHKVAVFPVGSSMESDEMPANYVPIPTRYQNGDSSGIEVEVKPGEENTVELNLDSKV